MLEHPTIRALHDSVLNEYEPPVWGKKAVMLMQPCTKGYHWRDNEKAAKATVLLNDGP